MIHYRQYRPAYFEGFTSDEGEVHSVPDLLSLPFVHHWSRNPQFHQFSLNRDSEFPTNHNLMAELDHGFIWWVVAKVWDTNGELASLPLWSPKER